MEGQSRKRARSISTVGLFAAVAVSLSFAVALSADARHSRPKCFGKVATIVDSDEGHAVAGTNGPDVIVAGGGADMVGGGRGNDRICSGGGRDFVIGELGNDMINAGPKADY